MAIKRHLPNTNNANDIRTAFGKIWDAIERGGTATTGGTTSNASAVGGGASGGSPTTGVGYHKHIVDDVNGLPDQLAGKQPLMTAQTVTVQSGVLAVDAVANLSVTLAKVADILSITTDGPAWVRFYRNSASRTSDAARPLSQDPESAAGISADLLTVTGKLSISTDPALTFSGDTSTAYLSVINKGTGDKDVSLTIRYLPREF